MVVCPQGTTHREAIAEFAAVDVVTGQEDGSFAPDRVSSVDVDDSVFVAGTPALAGGSSRGRLRGGLLAVS